MTDAVVKSAVRAIEVLGFFATVRRPTSLKDICRNFGYPQSSMTVLLKTLTSMGYLNYDRANRVYLPTIKVTTLGEWIPQYLFRSGIALDMLRDLNYATGETVNLSIRNDIYVNYVAVIQSTHALRFHLKEGRGAPVHRTSAGWALLAAMEDAEAKALIERSVAAEDAAEVPDPEAIWEQVLITRQAGYAYAENTLILGAGGIAMSLPIRIQGHVTTFGCGGPCERLRENRSRYVDFMNNGVSALRAAMDREQIAGVATEAV